MSVYYNVDYPNYYPTS